MYASHFSFQTKNSISKIATQWKIPQAEQGSRQIVDNRYHGGTIHKDSSL